MLSIWMPNVILVDNVQAKINVLAFNFPRSTYNSMFIAIVYYSAYFVVEQNILANHSLLHIIFCHKLCLFCRTLVSMKTCSNSCLLDIHRHFIRLLQELISIDNFFP
jgi:hypothetical protein